MIIYQYAVADEDRVVHLLASLPESFNMLVTALEEVPKMEVVTERLLHKERNYRSELMLVVAVIKP